MEPKPEYRFECAVIDDTNQKIVIRGSTYLSGQTSVDGANESVDMEVASILRAFRNKFQEDYEAKNYKVEEKDEQI